MTTAPIRTMRLLKVGRKQIHVRFYRGEWTVRRWRIGYRTPYPATIVFLPFGEIIYSYERTLFGAKDPINKEINQEVWREGQW